VGAGGGQFDLQLRPQDLAPETRVALGLQLAGMGGLAHSPH